MMSQDTVKWAGNYFDRIWWLRDDTAMGVFTAYQRYSLFCNDHYGSKRVMIYGSSRMDWVMRQVIMDMGAEINQPSDCPQRD